MTPRRHSFLVSSSTAPVSPAGQRSVKPTARPWCLRERPAHGAGAAGAALQPEAAGRDPAGIGDGSGAGAAARAQRPLDAVRGDHRAHGVHSEGGELGAGVPVGGAVDRAVELGRAQPEVSALPGDDEVTPRFVFVTQRARQAPAFRPGKESAKPVRASSGAIDQSAAVAQEHQPCELFPIARA